MSLSTAEKPRDPLASLRISRLETPPPPRGRFRWLSRLLVLVVVLAALAGGVFAAQRAGALAWTENLQSWPEVRVGSVSVETGRASDATVVASGYLESIRQARIGARAPGRIEILNVDEGVRVKQGETLAILEHADLKAALAAAKATLQRSQAEVAEQEVEIARTKRKHDRMIKLRKANASAEAELDDTGFAHDAAVAKLSSMKAAVALAEARVAEAEQMTENMYVRAPFDGTVISKDAELGESILPGGLGEGSGRGSVVTIADLQHLEVDCDVKEDYISRVSVGLPAEVKVDAVPDRRYKGRVRKVIPMGDRARATIKVKVEILDVDERLFPEMSSTVYFLPSKETDDDNAKRRIFCPSDAIVSEPDGSQYVWVLDSESRVKRTDIQTSAANNGRTVIESGLTGGERVVQKPSPDLAAGQRVKVVE